MNTSEEDPKCDSCLDTQAICCECCQPEGYADDGCSCILIECRDCIEVLV